MPTDHRLSNIETFPAHNSGITPSSAAEAWAQMTPRLPCCLPAPLFFHFLRIGSCPFLLIFTIPLSVFLWISCKCTLVPLPPALPRVLRWAMLLEVSSVICADLLPVALPPITHSFELLFMSPHCFGSNLSRWVFRAGTPKSLYSSKPFRIKVLSETRLPVGSLLMVTSFEVPLRNLGIPRCVPRPDLKVFMGATGCALNFFQLFCCQWSRRERPAHNDVKIPNCISTCWLTAPCHGRITMSSTEPSPFVTRIRTAGPR